MCVSIYVIMCVCIYVCEYLCVYVFVCVCHLFEYVCMCLCVYLFTVPPSLAACLAASGSARLSAAQATGFRRLGVKVLRVWVLRVVGCGSRSSGFSSLRFKG